MNNNDKIQAVLNPVYTMPLPAKIADGGCEEQVKRVWCLYRVSTVGQVDHDDIPLQRIECRAFAEQQGNWAITKELHEKGVSGYKVSSNDRDAIIEAKRGAIANEYDILLVFMFDRIGRREDETPFVVQWFVDNGIQVWSTREGQQRFDTHVDKLLNYIRYWQASGESEKTSMRISARHQQMTEQGLYCGGLVPFGYRLENLGRENKKKQPVKDLVVDEQEAAIVREIFAKCNDEGWGTYRIANWLNSRGIPTKRGTTLWRDTSIRVILRNPVYAGRLKVRDTYTAPFEHLRLVTDTEFTRAVQMLQSRATHNPNIQCIGPQKTVSGGLLTGLVYCAECGSRLSINHCKKVKDTITGRHEYRWVVYRCYRKLNSKKTCSGQSTYRTDRVEGYVEKAVHTFLSRIKTIPNDDLLKSVLLRENAVQQKAVETAQANFDKVKREYIALEEEAVKSLTGESTFSTDFLTGIIPKKRDALEQAQQEFERVILEKQAEDESLESSKIAVSRAKDWAEKYDSANLETKRMILANLINRVEVGRDYQIHIDFKLTLEQFVGNELYAQDSNKCIPFLR